MVAHTAIVLAEGDVEHPVQSVLDRPMRADRFAENGRIIATARQEIADLGLHLGCAVDAADGLDGHRGARIRLWCWEPIRHRRVSLPIRMRTVPFKLNQNCRHHIPRQRHKVTNWPDYEASLRQRGSLTVWFTEEAIVRPGLLSRAPPAAASPGIRRWRS